MVLRPTLDSIREQTCKPRDAWWTVLLVDPLALRLVRLVSPYRRISPNVLTGIATVLGLGAAACFAADALVAGALLFHLSFVADCMDGKIARLHGTASLFGAWFDFVFDRVRVFLCALGLFGGRYAATGDVTYLWALSAVVFLDLFRYVNAQQMAKIRQGMRDRLVAAGPVPPQVTEPVVAGGGLRGRFKRSLHARRIREHLFSGIEFEMTVFVVAPLTGAVVPLAGIAGVLLLVFESFLILRLWQATRAFPVALARAQALAAAAAAVDGAAVRR